MSTCSFALSGIPYGGCDTNLAGVKNIYIGDRSKFDIADNTGADGAEKLIVLNSGAENGYLYQYVPADDTASLTKTLTRNDSTGTRYFTNEVVANFNKMDKAKRQEMMELLNGDLIVIVEDNNDIFWLLGYNKRVIVSVLTGATGASVDDGNMYSVTFTDRSAALPFTIDGSSVDGLIFKGTANA